jgi:pimeloyl-ACP methyl ester carboxylesterase
MYIERYGNGEGAYFGLHGWGGGRETFAPMARFVPDSATLYAADLPGYGRSPAPHSWDVEHIGRQIAEAVIEIGAPRVTLIGNCSGAILGLVAARHLGERIERYVLIDPFAYMPWYFKLFVATSFGRHAYYTTFANPLGRWLTNLSLKGRRTSRSNLTNSFSRVDHEVAYNYLAMLARIDGIARFGNLTAPVEIVYGEKTFRAIKESAKQWASLWPHARCWELSGAGHLPIEEATGQLGKIIFAR